MGSGIIILRDFEWIRIILEGGVILEDGVHLKRWGLLKGLSSLQWDGLYLRGCSSFERVSLNLNLRDIFKGDGYLRD